MPGRWGLQQKTEKGKKKAWQPPIHPLVYEMAVSIWFRNKTIFGVIEKIYYGQSKMLECLQIYQVCQR